MLQAEPSTGLPLVLSGLKSEGLEASTDKKCGTFLSPPEKSCVASTAPELKRDM